MSRFIEMCNKYKNIDEIYDTREQREIRNILQAVKAEELSTLSLHRHYLSLLNKLRKAIVTNDELHGKAFNNWLESNLSVGEDGLYSDKLRFIFELIQNVDDCDFENIQRCELDVQFNTLDGCIVLTYNELGFKPKDVFAITGIAEKSKNVSVEKIEIGEKGIGFKSVFGVAQSVLIQSGCFSFKLVKNNFTVPIPEYNSFKPIKGTKLTLFMPHKQVEEIYEELVCRYCKTDVLVNNNPILFLNKLSKVKFYIDNSFRNLEFNVSRSNFKMFNDIAFEDNVIVSVNLVDPNRNGGKRISQEIKCYRYSKNIVYDRTACISRYLEDTQFQEKKLNLVAIFPQLDSLSQIKGGSMYSFLPTQIKTTVPLIIHVPFKLDASREYVDPQGKNKWFLDTCAQLSCFLKNIYIHLSHIVNESIVEYIPTLESYFFNTTYQKVECLKRSELKGSLLEKEELFCTDDGAYLVANDICSFSHLENVENAKEVYLILGEKKQLFIPPIKIDMSRYGVSIIKDAYDNVFLRGLLKEEITEAALELLDTVPDFKPFDIFSNNYKYVFSANQLRSIEKHKKIFRYLKEIMIEQIIKGMRPKIAASINLNLPEINQKYSAIINETLEDIDTDSNLMQYLKLIKRNYQFINEVSDDFFFSTQNALILSSKAPLESFAEFAKKVDKSNRFTAVMLMRQISENLDKIDDTISNMHYLKELRSQRKNIKMAFGDEVYKNYIQIINKSGADWKRFINELLQNADDCLYDQTGLPYFSFEFKEDILTTQYNENGFTKENVRSITAIGESTKKLLLDGESTIGEKGVGFKLVFSVAQSVEIHSNGFHFKLTDQAPTIPARTDPIKSTGTMMVFKLKKSLEEEFLTESKVLFLCICLRKLKKLTMGKFRVNIKDFKNTRIISVNEKDYEFEKFRYNFIVNEVKDVDERKNGKKQKIVCYIPKSKNINRCPLYCGLPTSVITNIPMIIDAPFELTTSRDDILQNKWNDIVKENMYKAIVDTIQRIKQDKRIDIFAFIKHDNTTFSSTYLNQFNLRNLLMEEDILPILKRDSFGVPKKGEYIFYPAVINILLEIDRSINIDEKNTIEYFGREKYIEVLKWLDCKQAPIDIVIRLLSEYVNSNITDETFRTQVYNYLKNVSESKYLNIIKTMKIIPVKGKRKDKTEYIAFNNKIYYGNEEISSSEYYLIRDKLLSQEDFYAIFKSRINEMNQIQKLGIYRKKIENWINDTTLSSEKLSHMLLDEYNLNRKELCNCRDTLIAKRIKIPVKFESGEYNIGNRFISTNPSEYFYGDIIKNLIVDEEFEKFAQFMETGNLNNLRYEDIDYGIDCLTENDIEDFQDDSFVYGIDILEEYLKNDKIPQDLIEKYNLEGMQEATVYEEDYVFPIDSIKDLKKLKVHIRKQAVDPIKIVKEKVLTAVSFGKRRHGKSFRLDQSEFRKHAIDKYRSDENHEVCFCQMCQMAKREKFIEVNNIDYNPEYFWEEMKLSLCLECSKIFEDLRRNKQFRKQFIDNIRTACVMDEECIKVPIGNRTISFTQTHLAEIQEILNMEKEWIS